VSEAVAKLLRYDIGRMPVVERGDESRAVGYLGRAAILATRLRRFNDEHVVEPGWLKRNKIKTATETPERSGANG
jgi:CBS domain-containing protein